MPCQHFIFQKTVSDVKSVWRELLWLFAITLGKCYFTSPHVVCLHLIVDHYNLNYFFVIFSVIYMYKHVCGSERGAMDFFQLEFSTTFCFL